MLTMARHGALLPLMILFLSAAAAAAAATGDCVRPPADDGSTLRILHALGPCSPLGAAAPPAQSWADYLLHQSASVDDPRLVYLASLAAAPRRRSPVRRSFAPIASGRQLLQITNYVVRARLGTPAQALLVAVDTSNDAAWIPCSACAGCAPGSPSFSPAASSTFRPVVCGSPACAAVPNPVCPAEAKSCAFSLTYGGSSVEASLSQDSLSLASDVVAVYTFGCLSKVTGSSVPPQGLLGLGRGPLSFLSQTKSLYGGIFSYCLPSYKSLNFSGTLRLGSSGQPKRIKTTPLLTNPHRPSLYYVNMTAIRVGSHVVQIPAAALAFDPATGAGTVVDSGTMFTRLTAPAYAAVRDEFRRRVKAPVTSLGGFDTCYDGLLATAFPSVTFVFGDGSVQVTLPEENVVIHSTAGSIACLAMAAAPDGLNTVLNVVASMQQQNHRVLFDVANSRVGFARELCT